MLPPSIITFVKNRLKFRRSATIIKVGIYFLLESPNMCLIAKYKRVNIKAIFEISLMRPQPLVMNSALYELEFIVKPRK